MLPLSREKKYQARKILPILRRAMPLVISVLIARVPSAMVAGLPTLDLPGREETEYRSTRGVVKTSLFPLFFFHTFLVKKRGGKTMLKYFKKMIRKIRGENEENPSRIQHPERIALLYKE